MAVTLPGARKVLIPHFINQVPAGLTGGVVAVGNFDGVHAGHRALLSVAVAEAARRRVPAIVLTFEPHPRTVFKPETPVFRLTPLPVKARLLGVLGIDGLIVANFDRAFSTIPADTFVDEILVGRLKLTGAVVGFNFHFGRGRAGTPALLAEAGARKGFAVTVVDQVLEADGPPVSSTAIRDNLAAGEFALANARLGYRWFVAGEVVPGDRRGRELGYPTANIRLPADCRLRHGIYAVRVQRADGSLHEGVASYGRRPTFDNGPPILETFIFDFDDDLYGETLTVSLVGWIRPELKFDTVGELVAAMEGDSKSAREMLAAAGPGTQLDQALAAET